MKKLIFYLILIIVILLASFSLYYHQLPFSEESLTDKTYEETENVEEKKKQMR